MRQAIADWLNGPDTVADRVESGRPVPRGIDPGALAAASGFRGRESQRPTDRAVLLSLGRDFVALLARSRQQGLLHADLEQIFSEWERSENYHDPKSP